MCTVDRAKRHVQPVQSVNLKAQVGLQSLDVAGLGWIRARVSFLNNEKKKKIRTFYRSVV